jgi:hypothetical protein
MGGREVREARILGFRSEQRRFEPAHFSYGA